MNRKPISRREFLRLSAVATGAMLAACAPAPTAAPAPTEPPAAAGFDWKQFAGTELNVILNKVPYDEITISHVAEFEELTDIKVVADVVPSGEFYQKTLLALTTTPEKLDIFLWGASTFKWKFLREGFFTDLMPFLNDSSLTNPDFDFEDFQKGQVAALSNSDGTKLWAIPYVASGLPFAYRKDVYEEKGLSVPTTFEALESNAAACHDPDNEFYGFLARGVAPWLTHTFGCFVYGFGATYVDEEGNATIDTPEMIEAIDYYGRMLREYGPPGPLDLDDAKANALFSQGLAAHCILPAQHLTSFCDPEKSEVVDKVGWFVPPGGSPITDAIGQSINSGSVKKEAAWYFIQWWMNQENFLRRQLQAELSTRNSTYEEPEYKETMAAGGCLPDLYPILQEISSTGNGFGHPPAEDILASRTAVAAAVAVAIQGGDVKAAAEKADADYQALLDETGGLPLD